MSPSIIINIIIIIVIFTYCMRDLICDVIYEAAIS